MCSNKTTKQILDDNWVDIVKQVNSKVKVAAIAKSYKISPQSIFARLKSKKLPEAFSTTPSTEVRRTVMISMVVLPKLEVLLSNAFKTNKKLTADDVYIKAMSIQQLNSNTPTPLSYFSTATEDDTMLLQTLMETVNYSDIVVGYDIKEILNKRLARFMLKNKPTDYRVIDLKDSLYTATGERYDTFSKVVTNVLKSYLVYTSIIEDKSLWLQCYTGNKTAVKFSIRKRTEEALNKTKDLFKILKPWIKNLPNLTIAGNNINQACPACRSVNISKFGYTYTNVSKFQRFKCNDCGAHSRSRFNSITKEEKAILLTPIH